MSRLHDYIEKFESHNSAIREFAYEELSKKVNENSFSNEEKMALLKLLSSDEYLFYRIRDEENNDSVRRSFSILGITLLISSDPCLDLLWLMPKMLDYIKNEQDFRGKDDNVGWIHSFAHLGDFLANLSLNKKISTEAKANFIICLLEKVASIENYPLLFGEDLRIAKGIAYCIEDNPDINFDQIIDCLSKGVSRDMPYNFNSCNVVKSLYFELSKQEKGISNEAIKSKLLKLLG